MSGLKDGWMDGWMVGWMGRAVFKQWLVWPVLEKEETETEGSD